MDAGLLDLSIGWKEQDNRCLAKVYDAVREFILLLFLSLNSEVIPTID
jgi:hypothetical protein